MKYVMHLGVLHDVLAYGVLHFNFKAVREYYERSAGYFEDAYVHYDKLKSQMPPIPRSLYAFFYTNGKKSSFISYFMFSEFDFFKDTFDDFLLILEEYVDIPSRMLAHFFDEQGIEDDISEDLTKSLQRILELESDNDLKVSLVTILVNWEQQRGLLLNYLRHAYPIIEKYHEQLYDDSIKMIAKFSSERFLDKLRQYLEIDGHINIKKQSISISYLNSFLVMSRYNRQEQYVFVMGKYGETVVDRVLNFEFKTPHELFDIMGKPIIRKLLECLYIQDYTATQLTDKLHTSRQSISRHLLWIHDFMLIRVSKKNGPEIYYTINASYFQVMQPRVAAYLMRFARHGEDKSQKEAELQKGCDNGQSPESLRCPPRKLPDISGRRPVPEGNV